MKPNTIGRLVISPLLVIASLAVSVQAEAIEILSWSQLAELPPIKGQAIQPGLAGAFCGIHNDALIIAGGANFARPVWESSKVWHDDIYVLVKESEGSASADESYRWITGFKLERPMAYGASVSSRYGIVCIGGNDSERTYSQVFLLQWDPQSRDITRTSLPSLPDTCAYSSAAMIADTIYVVGGTAGLGLETAKRNFWSLDMSRLNDPGSFKWKQVLAWPGPPRAFAIAVAQHNGTTDCLYVISGRRINTEEESNPQVQFLTDVYEFAPANYEPEKYNPQTDTYTGKVNPWRKRKDVPRCVMAGTAISVGQSHIIMLGGDDGSLYHKVDELKDDHPGFPKEAVLYHTITDTWTSAGSIPVNHLTTTAVRWGTDPVSDPIVIPSGEIRPRVRSPKVWHVRLPKSGKHFGMIDFSAVGIYLSVIIGVGVFFSFRNKNSDDFFRGGQRVPWLVAGLSIFATMLSSITFIAIPAKAYATDWVYFIYNMTAIAITPLVILLFLPFFRKIDATSAYEYLERRFNRPARLFASASFILFQIGRMAVVMYLPALALAAITPMSEYQCILLMGVLCIIYCTMGGLQAVVWTDTIQTCVLLGGALISLALIISRVDGGVSGFISTAVSHNKFQVINWDFSSMSFATAALWVVVLGGITQNLVPYTSDMAIVQRYMSVRDMSSAKRAIWTNAIAVLPASLLFFGVGTALFVFYLHNPGRLDPGSKTDAIFPLFIARELPAGTAGLVVAGIFAAAQSTISTSMNSTSTALVTDFIRPLNLIQSERGYLRLARVSTFALGVLGTVLALLFASSNIRSLWDQFMKILGLFGGSMCGLFCLGIFTKRANGPGAIMGAVAGAAGVFLVEQYTDIHFLLYAFVGIMVCCLCGYFASAMFPASTKSIAGLTIHTLNRFEIMRKKSSYE
jgi:SSS family transporter